MTAFLDVIKLARALKFFLFFFLIILLVPVIAIVLVVTVLVIVIVLVVTVLVLLIVIVVIVLVSVIVLVIVLVPVLVLILVIVLVKEISQLLGLGIHKVVVHPAVAYCRRTIPPGSCVRTLARLPPSGQPCSYTVSDVQLSAFASFHS